MNFKILFFSVFIILSSFQIIAQTNCDKLPSRFSSYSDAISKVEASKFLYTDIISGNFSSWLSDAKYYSCDKFTGYLILRAKGKKYIHKGLSVDTWRNFKNSSSKGSFYTNYIRGRFELQLTNY